ncbi:Ig-like domain-containing protein, partial [Oerskovia rustica]
MRLSRLVPNTLILAALVGAGFLIPGTEASAAEAVGDYVVDTATVEVASGANASTTPHSFLEPWRKMRDVTFTVTPGAQFAEVADGTHAVGEHYACNSAVADVDCVYADAHTFHVVSAIRVDQPSVWYGATYRNSMQFVPTIPGGHTETVTQTVNGVSLYSKTNTSANRADWDPAFVPLVSTADIRWLPADVTAQVDGTDDTTRSADLSGTGDPGATVTVTDADGAELASATVAADGTWSTTVQGLHEGANDLAVEQSVPGGPTTHAEITVGITPAADPADPADPTDQGDPTD